jgi:hypothetical protein
MKRTLDSILKDFDVSGKCDKAKPVGSMIGVWLPDDYKARYDNLQTTSGRRFSKKVREVIIAMIDMAQAKAS